MNPIGDQVIGLFFDTNRWRIEQWIDEYESVFDCLPTFREFYREFLVSDDWDVTLRTFLELLEAALDVNVFELKEQVQKEFDSIIRVKEATANGHEHVGTAGIFGSDARTS